MTEADKIIAIVQPKYSENSLYIQKLLKEAEKKEAEKDKEGKEKKIREAIEKVKPQPVWDHAITYDSGSEQLEPVYFWILDFMQDMKFKVEKIVDNFAATAGGGYFAEIGARATKMQEEGMKILGAINTVIKSIINIIYDLKEFEIRLKQYDLAKSKDPKEAEAGLLGLKQIWLDKVDMQRGRGSIHAMTYELGFVTLRDAFITVKTLEDVDKLDLNDRVKRVLKPRVSEFLEWKARSEIELRKRYEIEKSYLKSQVGALKLYTRWAKPYLKAAEQLMMTEKKLTEPSLVSAFNTLLLELCILGTSEINIAEAVDAKLLPPSFRDLKLKRPYYACILVDFAFRGIPQRVSQAGHYAFGGRVDVSFKAFALNEDELKVFKKQLEKEDFYDAIRLVQATTEESILQMTEDIAHFLEEDKEEKKEKKKKEEKKEKEPELGKIKKDNFEESIIRAFAEQQAASLCFKIYDIYKKSHGMASFAEPEWEIQRWRERK